MGFFIVQYMGFLKKYSISEYGIFKIQKFRFMKERLLKDANEIIESMEYFKSFIEKIPEDRFNLEESFYMVEMDLKMFKNKFKRKDISTRGKN